MEISDIAAHGGTALGTASIFSWISKTVFKTWLKRQEEERLALKEALKDLTGAVSDLKIEVTKISVVLERFDAIDKKTQELDKAVAVAQHCITETQSDLNGLGRKMRTMETS